MLMEYRVKQSAPHPGGRADTADVAGVPSTPHRHTAQFEEMLDVGPREQVL